MNNQQEVIFKLMKWFHNFCCENNLTYYMLGGTMLGSIRHSGFIPWDDDADFGMPRPDYERFIELTLQMNFKEEDQLIESYRNNNSDFPYYFLKIYNRKSTLIEQSKNPIVRGVYIDVFPLDGLGNNYKKACKYQNKCFSRINFFNAKRFALSKKRSFLKNISIIVARTIPPYKNNFIKTSHKLNLLVQNYDYNESEFVTNFFGAWQKKESMKKEIFGTPKLYKFENCLFYGPEQSDNYLKQLYGNYMELPPIEKRGFHHSYLFCDLDCPFENYNKERIKI